MKHDKIADVNRKLLYRPGFFFACTNNTVVLCLCLYTSYIGIIWLWICDQSVLSSILRPHLYSKVRTEYDGVTCTV